MLLEKLLPAYPELAVQRSKATPTQAQREEFYPDDDTHPEARLGRDGLVYRSVCPSGVEQ